MGKKVYTATALTGGSSGALDAINGSLLVDGDLAIVTYGGRAYLYELDHDNSSAEASPFIILPDKNYGTKRWVWQPVEFGNATLARAYLGTAQTGLASAAATKVLLDTESFDVGSNFASYKYVVPVTGYYQISWSAYLRNDGGAVTRGLSYLYKNGAVVSVGGYFDTTGDMASTGSDCLYLAAADYLELYALAITSSSTWKIETSALATFLSVHLVSKG